MMNTYILLSWNLYYYTYTHTHNMYKFIVFDKTYLQDTDSVPFIISLKEIHLKY